MDADLINRLRKNSEEVGECWEWRGATQRNGITPMMNWGGCVNGVRRVIAEARGDDLKGKVATYKCGNHSCVNPEHVVVTTRQRVQRRSVRELRYNLDITRNKRLADVMRIKRAKITMEIAQEIREAEGPQKQIGARYGVSQSTVSAIKRGETWKTYSSPWAGLIGGLK